MRLSIDAYKSLVEKHAKRADPEGELQTMCVTWFRSMRRFRKCQLVAIPNEGKRTPAVAAKLKRQGMHPGVADLVLRMPDGRLAWIEMKAPGRSQSPTQLEFEDWCQQVGAPYFVCHSFAAFEQACFSLVPEDSA